MAAADVGRVQGSDQARWRRHQEFRRTPRRCRDGRDVSKGVRGGICLGAPRHCRHRLFRNGSGYESQGTGGSPDGYLHRIRSRESSLTSGTGAKRISLRLGLVAGALLYAPTALRAQVVLPPASQVPIPVKPKTDSGPDSAHVKTDTIKAPIGRSADPALYEIGPQYEWNRAQLFATGSLSVADLLDRIPGVTTFRSGWLATPQTASYAGDFQQIRVFYDGVEIDNLDDRTGGVLDLSSVQLWSLEHLSIERTGGRVRIYMRSWRVDNTDPYTRVDVATGNEDTNLYRGFYGKRFDNGGVRQFAGQQFGVTSTRFAGSGDALSLLTRVGVARKSWSIDGFVLRHHPTRDIQRPIAGSGRPPVLALDATYTDAYLRAAVGGVNSGPWAEVTVASLGFKGTTSPDRNVSSSPLADTLERRASETQYNVSAGLTLGALRVEADDRLRALGGVTYNSTSARADIASPIGTLSGFVEHDGFRGRTSADVGLRAQPLPFFAVSGSVTPSIPFRAGAASLPNSTSMRGEAAIKIVGPRGSAGVLWGERVPVAAPFPSATLLLAPERGRA